MSGPTVDDHGQVGIGGQILAKITSQDPITAADLRSFSTGWPPLTEAEQIRARLNKRLRGNKWPNTTKSTP